MRTHQLLSIFVVCFLTSPLYAKVPPLEIRFLNLDNEAYTIHRRDDFMCVVSPNPLGYKLFIKSHYKGQVEVVVNIDGVSTTGTNRGWLIDSNQSIVLEGFMSTNGSTNMSEKHLFHPFIWSFKQHESIGSGSSHGIEILVYEKELKPQPPITPPATYYQSSPLIQARGRMLYTKTGIGIERPVRFKSFERSSKSPIYIARMKMMACND